jgi:signal transduction histidine kinase
MNPLAQKILTRHEGIFEGKGMDNVERAYAVSSVRDDDSDGMKVAVGMRTDLLFAEADAAGKGNLIVLGLVMVLALGASSLIAERSLLEPVGALMEAANRFASADFSARAKVSRSTAELHDLSEAFNAMAERLEQRESELRKAHSEIQSINARLEEKVRERTSELVAANREMEAFTYSVSHDLRAPLRHLDGFAQMLAQQRREQLDATAQRYLDVISRSAKTMGTLIDDLLVFSRMGKQELNRKTIEMGKVVQDAMSEVGLDAKGRKVEWKVDELPIVKADGNLIKQVWANLLGNALKYTGPKAVARIEIGYRRDAGEHCFYVRDNGVGFDSQYADKLFGVFHRLHSDSEFEGTGIGLANVKRIVQRHGGRVWGESVLGESATFYFTLPTNENDAA